MKKTKKAKKIKITHEQSIYNCPNCGTEFHDSRDENVIRFICGNFCGNCGQKITIERIE